MAGPKKSGELRDHGHLLEQTDPSVLAQHPNMQLMPVNPMNQLELMTVDQMADMINSFDDSDKVRRINYMNLACMAINKHSDARNMNKMREAFEAYATLCSLTGIVMTNAAAYYCMGIDTGTAYRWMHGKESATPERSALIREVNKVCAMNREAMAAAGLINPVLSIFWHKNYDNFSDQGMRHDSAELNLGERKSAQELAEKYQGVIELDE